MPIGVKKILLEKIRLRYLKSSKHQKTLILDEFCATTGLTRKHAIRLLNNEIKAPKAHPGPKYLYGPEVRAHVVKIWEAMGQICSKNMKAALPLWLEFYDCSQESKYLLYKISRSTIDRILQEHRNHLRIGKSSTVVSMLKNKIPIKLLDHKITEPGFVEADTVAHCGSSLAGEFVNTLTVTDVWSSWTENRAVWSKKGKNVLNAISDIERCLPFSIKGFSSDNGNEFLNNDLYTFFQGRSPKKVAFVRGRPYKKNDNCFVEQKNWTHVRQLLGYDRLDEFWDVDYINDMYKNYWNPLKNFFIPTLKLESKTRHGGKLIKTYGEPKTPYQRIVESESVSNDDKKLLEEKFKSLNPFKLRNELNHKLKWFFRIVEIRKKQSSRSA